jgi:tocopherol O-methyltransferase
MLKTIRTDQPIMRNRAKIMRIIADFWDKTSEGWRVIWGPHIHHGYYENNTSLTPLQAQEILIDKLAEMIEIKSNAKILDVGCGMGGSSIYLAKKFGTTVTGITLSKKQVAIASQQCQFENIKNVDFKIEDALTLESFEDNSFDIVWSLESCEQFYDKYLFVKQAYRVLKPGGKLMLATWCSDRDEYEGKLAVSYKKLCLAFDLPYMPTIQTYQALIKNGGFKVLKVFDWSDYVKKSWDIGISLVSAYSFIHLIRMGGWRGFCFVRQVKMMQNAFNQQIVKYGVFLASKN